MSGHFVVRLEAVTKPKTGVWCDRCLLPSAIEVVMAALHGERLLHVGTYTRCTECPEENVLAQGTA